MESIKRGVVSLVSEEDLQRKLQSGKKLRIKLGVDPTSADLHLGHSVVLTKLRQFQDLGHTAVLIIGDYTAMVGDPSGRDSTRPALNEAQVSANAETYKQQAFKVLDQSKAEIRRNSEWLKPFMEKELLGWLRKYTIQQILEREDFKKRINEGSPLTILETLYPMLQGYDSVAVKADVELGGNDQLTNLLMGRRMQKDVGQEPQVCLTVPLLVGLDGAKKMSKSYGNSIGLTEDARDMFGKLMRVSDELMKDYYELLLGQDLPSGHPMEAKKELARRITALYHGDDIAMAERRFFEDTFSKKELPADIPTYEGEAATLVDLVAAHVKSKGEARRLIEQGGVKIDGRKAALDEKLPGEFTLQVGKHKFVRCILRRTP